jgi:hypothetical protein
MLASVLAYGVLLSETQYRLWRPILPVLRTSAGVYNTLRYTSPFDTLTKVSPSATVLLPGPQLSS